MTTKPERYSFGKPFLLAEPGGNDTITDLRGGFAGPFGGDLAKLHRWHFDMNVDPVQQRTGRLSCMAREQRL